MKYQSICYKRGLYGTQSIKPVSEKKQLGSTSFFSERGRGV